MNKIGQFEVSLKSGLFKLLIFYDLANPYPQIVIFQLLFSFTAGDKTPGKEVPDTFSALHTIVRYKLKRKPMNWNNEI